MGWITVHMLAAQYGFSFCYKGIFETLVAVCTFTNYIQ